MLNQQSSHSGIFNHPVIHFLLLFSLIVTIYSNTLRSPFVLDDLSCIQYNELLQLEKITVKNLWDAAFSPPITTRPVANISFALNYYFNQDFDLVCLHLTNIIIHFLNTILLYYFVQLTLKTPALKNLYTDNRQWIPLLTAVLWAVHPLHTQSITYIVQRMNSLAVLFYLLSFVCYINARFSKKKSPQILLTALCLFSGVLAFGSKEISITLPGFILLYEFFFFQNLDRAWLKQKKLFLISLFTSGLILFLFKFGLVFWETIPASYAHRNFTLTERLLTEPRVILFYLSLFIFPLPSRLSLEHDFKISHSFIDPVTTLPAILFLFLLVFLAVLLTRKERLLAFAIFWFLGNLALESTFIPLEIIFEHRTYLPSMMLNLALGVILIRFLPYQKFVPVVIILTIAFAIGSYERNKTWKSELSLLVDCVKKSPNNSRPLVNLANTLIINKRVNLAIPILEKAVRLDTLNVEAKNSLGAAYAQTGKFALAIDQFDLALQIDPTFRAASENKRKAIQDQRNLNTSLPQTTQTD